ncbi:MAG: T9SS type A sorting domain-containing protein [Bacteroidota bacterium]
MRRLLLLPLLLALPAAAQTDVIPNASFDVWSALDPAGWLASNDAEMTFRTVDPVADARSGPLAAQMSVTPVPGFPQIPIPPAMETCAPSAVCRDNPEFENAAFPVSQRHEAFCGYYKASLLDGDKILLGTFMTVGDEEPVAVLNQATGDGFITENAADWTRFIKPFTYVSDETPTDGVVVFSIVAGSFPSQDVPTVGSTATLDDLYYCNLDGAPTGGGDGGLDSGDALLIIDDAGDPAFADLNVEGLLGSLGFDVLVRSDEAATNADADDKAIILISGSVDPAVLTAGYDQTAVPLILWEPALYGDLRLTAASAFGSTGAVTDVEITNEDHPIAVGFALGDTTVYALASPMTFGQPGGDAVTVGTADGQAVLFAYDDGAAMASGTAPARRVGFFADNDGLGEATGAGIQLLENAIIWAADLDLPVASDPVPGATPSTLTLTANFPNPFAASTTLEYALPEAGPVSLAVYDALGRRVAVLTDETQAAGRYRAAWNAGGLAAGVYLAVLRAGGQVQTRRMLLMR